MNSIWHDYPTQINGHGATLEHLSPLAFAGFAHFTAMQIRNRKMKGLDLHLERLRQASGVFFGTALTDDLIRSYIRSAIAGPENQSLIVSVYPEDGEFTRERAEARLSVLVRGGPPSSGPAGPLRLKSVVHERAFADIKHVGEASKTFYLREANRQGFDDAVFVDRHGVVSEGTIWNLAFWDGNSVVWPEAAMLSGTMMSIVQRRLIGLGVPQRQERISLDRLGHYPGAAVMNSWSPGIDISAIDSISTPASSELTEVLWKAYELEPFVEI